MSADTLVTWAEVKAQLTSLETADETAVTALIETVSVRCNRYTGRKLKSRSLTEYYDGRGGTRLKLNQYPVTAISELNVDSERVWGTGTALSALTAGVGDYLYDGDTGIITRFDENFPEGELVIKVTYTAGYSTVPDDLKQAVYMMIAQSLAMQRGNGVGVKSTSIQGMTTTYEDRIPFTALQILNTYRDGRVA